MSDRLSSPYTFFTAAEYRRELLALLRKTKRGDRVLMMSMTFEPTEPEIGMITEELVSAVSRGVQVSFAIDAHSFLVQPNHFPGPLWPRRAIPEKLPQYYQNKLQFLHTINEHPNGHAAILNMPGRSFTIPVAGRSHIKAAIINDQIYLGGCNLQGIKLIDIMVGWQDKESADDLHEVLQKIIHGQNTRKALGGSDRGMKVGGSTEIMIDSGMRNQSLIFDEALQLIDRAEEWLVITCQFFPNSITARHLSKAIARGVKVEVIYSHPNHHGLVGGAGQHISILREEARLPKALFAHALKRTDPMLHAKLIACDKGLMLGSHNYVSAGVMLGTAEIAFKNNDKQLARAAVDTLHRGLKNA